MNICNIDKPRNHLKTFLKDNKFKQIVYAATHINGGHIDHGYFLNYEETPEIVSLPKYYSDHDSLCISLKKAYQDI